MDIWIGRCVQIIIDLSEAMIFAKSCVSKSSLLKSFKQKAYLQYEKVRLIYIQLSIHPHFDYDVDGDVNQYNKLASSKMRKL